MNNNELTKEIALHLRIRAAIAGVFAKSKPQKPKQVRTYNNVPDRVETAINALQVEIKKNTTHAK